MNSKQKRALRDLIHAGGIVLSSKWITGERSNTNSRNVPPFCQKLEKRDCKKILSGEVLENFLALERAHPRAVRFVAVTADLEIAKSNAGGEL
tara:strand:- start:2062 stop:2340 length:279 start_codon:yes stop_codon:yes gene_type:complete